MPVDIFLGLSNDIMGEAQDDVHADKIDIETWSWGMSQSGTTHEGGGGGGGKVSVQDMALSKYVDLSSHDLIKKCTNGTHIESGELIVRKAGGDSTVEYFKIIMEAIIISTYSTGGSANGLDRVTENLSLNFRYFEVIYTLQDAAGGAGAESMAGWDIAANAEWGA